MQREVFLPQVELTMESALISKWLVCAGDRVTAQQPILEVETQKATSEVPAPAAGYVRRLCVEEGQTVGEKALLCILTDTADEPLKLPHPPGCGPGEVDSPIAKTSSPSTFSKGEAIHAQQIKASPAARRLSREFNVDLSAVKGTGPGGRITEEDIRAVASGEASVDADGGLWQPLPAKRVALIDQMQKSLAEIPQIQVRRRLEVTPLLAKADGIKFTHRLVKAVAAALVRHPALRTEFNANRIRVKPVSVAIAVDSLHGLVAPVLRNADRLSLQQIAAAVTDFRAKADTDSLRRADLTDGPFAVSNLGMLGVDQFDAFVFHGQTAVLSVGRSTEDAPNKTSAWFGLAADHRVVDGAEAARFLETLQSEIVSS